MKCPKCSYLGFETGDRCKNCGYDFSLIVFGAESEEIEVDLNLDVGADGPSPRWAEEADAALGKSTSAAFFAPDDDFTSAARLPTAPTPPEQVITPPIAARTPVPVPAPRREPPLPLFARPVDEGDDQPLLKVPATPRPPLAVRKTPDIPRLRAVPKPARRFEPALQFSEDPAEDESPIAVDVDEERITAGPQRVRPTADKARPTDTPDRIPAWRTSSRASSDVTSGAGARAAAAAIDHVILSMVDLTVLYLTLRMSGLSMAEWQALPAAPLVAFLLLVKIAYFCAFTAVGGQTIGKMAAHIRVVTDAGDAVDVSRAMQRTMAAAISTLAFGLGFIPALIGAERRALHDRVAHTRVVVLRSA